VAAELSLAVVHPAKPNAITTTAMAPTGARVIGPEVCHRPRSLGYAMRRRDR
jgi:hypothetical protein